MAKIYEIGYNYPGSNERVAQIMQEPSVLLVDTRLMPMSRWRPEWRHAALRRQYGERYHHIPLLGNEHYKEPEKGIKIADPVRGIARLVELLHAGHDLVLVCQCRQYAKCHRSVIVDLLLEKMPDTEVVHQDVQPVQIAQQVLF